MEIKHEIWKFIHGKRYTDYMISIIEGKIKSGEFTGDKKRNGEEYIHVHSKIANLRNMHLKLTILVVILSIVGICIEPNLKGVLMSVSPALAFILLGYAFIRQRSHMIMAEYAVETQEQAVSFDVFRDTLHSAAETKDEIEIVDRYINDIVRNIGKYNIRNRHIYAGLHKIGKIK
ncbi:hypothetical protein NKB77_004906 [Salmonella enterica]|nr:hypothetical protein [Salmonella enterica]